MFMYMITTLGNKLIYMGIQLYNKVPVNTIKLIKYKPFKTK